MTTITSPTPPTYDIVGDADFNSRVIAATGDVNRALGLGTKTTVAERDISGDGVADTIVTFNSGKQLFVVSNYGETRRELTGHTQRNVTSPGRTEYTTTPATTREETYTDCSAREAALRSVGEDPEEVIELENGKFIPGAKTIQWAKRKAAAEATPCETRTRTITVPASSQPRHIPGETTTVNDPVYSNVPTHNWSDIDGDGRSEVVAGTFRVKDATSGMLSPSWTFVVETPPPPPPPPPPTPPAARGPKIGN